MWTLEFPPVRANTFSNNEFENDCIHVQYFNVCPLHLLKMSRQILASQPILSPNSECCSLRLCTDKTCVKKRAGLNETLFYHLSSILTTVLKIPLLRPRSFGFIVALPSLLNVQGTARCQGKKHMTQADTHRVVSSRPIA